MRHLGIDYGLKRVGVAISDEEGRIAFPERVVPNTKHLKKTIKILCEEKGVGEVILGESKDLEGIDNPVMKEIRKFKEGLEKETGLKVHLEPEYLTSVEARRTTGETNMHDASAAAIILQSFLDKKNQVG